MFPRFPCCAARIPKLRSYKLTYRRTSQQATPGANRLFAPGYPQFSVIMSPSPGAAISLINPRRQPVARIFLFLVVRIPANALYHPIRTKLFVLRHMQSQTSDSVSQNILLRLIIQIKTYEQRLTQGYHKPVLASHKIFS